MLSGKKTYIVAGLVGLATAIYHLGYITSDLYVAILGFLGAGGLASLRAGVKKTE